MLELRVDFPGLPTASRSQISYEGPGSLVKLSPVSSHIEEETIASTSPPKPRDRNFVPHPWVTPSSGWYRGPRSSTIAPFTIFSPFQSTQPMVPSRRHSTLLQANTLIPRAGQYPLTPRNPRTRLLRHCGPSARLSALPAPFRARQALLLALCHCV